MAEHPPFLKIGCAERGLKIDPPLITVSLKYLSATATFKHHSPSQGFYNPYHIPVIVMEIPTISRTYFKFTLPLFSLHGCTQFISLFSSKRMKKASVYSWPSCVFYSAVLCIKENLSIFTLFNDTPQYVQSNLLFLNFIFIYFVIFNNKHSRTCSNETTIYLMLTCQWQTQPFDGGVFPGVVVTLTVWSLVFSAATLIQGDSITATQWVCIQQYSLKNHSGDPVVASGYFVDKWVWVWVLMYICSYCLSVDVHLMC